METYSSFFVGLLDSVSCDVCVAIVFGYGPLQSHIEAPGVNDLHTGRRPWQLCDGIKNNLTLTVSNIISSQIMSPNDSKQLTNDLKDEGSLVVKVVHLHTHLVHSGVLSLSRTDEQDAVSVCAADVHAFCVQRLTILCPADHWFGLTLSIRNEASQLIFRAAQSVHVEEDAPVSSLP